MRLKFYKFQLLMSPAGDGEVGAERNPSGNSKLIFGCGKIVSHAIQLVPLFKTRKKGPCSSLEIVEKSVDLLNIVY